MRIPGLLLEDPLALPWQSTRVEGVHWIPLHLASTGTEAGTGRGAATVLIRMDPGRGYPEHLHVEGEEVLVLAGGYRDGLGEHRRGDHVHYPPGSRHAPVALGDPRRPIDVDNPACVLFASAPGGVELLDR